MGFPCLEVYVEYGWQCRSAPLMEVREGGRWALFWGTRSRRRRGYETVKDAMHDSDAARSLW